VTQLPDGLMPPPYGAGTLADVGPALLASLGVTDGKSMGADPFGFGEQQRVVLFLVDGLGWTALQRHRDAAPFLASMRADVIAAGFPATTATSLASLGTGLPPGEHGITGYCSYVDDVGSVVNWLAWRPVSENLDLRDRLVPEVVQPQQTVWERAAEAGIATTVCTYENFRDSGLTRAVLRGGRWGGTLAEGDAVARAAEAIDIGNRSLVYVYVSALDLVGHMRGPDTEAWRAQLAIVDRIAESLAGRLPAEANLVVTADHGMVGVPEDAKVDYDGHAALHEDVIALAGEPRMRHVHTRPGGADVVAGRWREVLGDGWLVLTGDAAIDAGLFGPVIRDHARRRIGDVVALATGTGGVVERRRLPRLASMPGQHGSLTDDELLVPLLRLR
jgi:hypothetical protein